MSTEIQPIKPGRLLSLDVFRGLTIAAMFLVNNAGDWGHVFTPLDHAEWLGCTATDLIFPFFLFIMGVAMTFSFAKHQGRDGAWAELLPHIVRRATILIVLGLILNVVSGEATGRTAFRWVGVLQRIGICYFVASLILLGFTIRGQAAWTAGILAVYAILMKHVPVPGHGAGLFTPEGNLATWIDTRVLGGHDPEGVLTTLPAVASTLAGCLTGHWLRDKSRDGNEKVAGMATAGLILFVLAALWQYDFPFSKKLWTSSYVLHTTALGLWTLAACYWSIDVKGVTFWTKPFVVYGTNAIAAYFGVGIMSYGSVWIHWFEGADAAGAVGKKVILKYWIYEHFFASWIPKVSNWIFPETYGPYISSAAYPMVMYVGLWCGLMWILYRRRIFIKV